MCQWISSKNVEKSLHVTVKTSHEQTCYGGKYETSFALEPTEGIHEIRFESGLIEVTRSRSVPEGADKYGPVLETLVLKTKGRDLSVFNRLLGEGTLETLFRLTETSNDVIFKFKSSQLRITEFTEFSIVDCHKHV